LAGSYFSRRPGDWDEMKDFITDALKDKKN